MGKGGSSAGAEDAAATVESTVNWRGSQKSVQGDSIEGVSSPVGTGDGDGDRDGQEMLAERRSELVVSEGGWINTVPVIG